MQQHPHICGNTHIYVATPTICGNCYMYVAKPHKCSKTTYIYVANATANEHQQERPASVPPLQPGARRHQRRRFLRGRSRLLRDLPDRLQHGLRDLLMIVRLDRRLVGWWAWATSVPAACSAAQGASITYCAVAAATMFAAPVP